LSRGKPFPPGKSGNPRGRPKAEVCLTALLRAALAERDVKGKRTKARAVIDALVMQACDGNARAIQQVFDRIDGILQPIAAETIDIGEIVAEVSKRAHQRKQAVSACEPAQRVH
jgi:hypothetical protein